MSDWIITEGTTFYSFIPLAVIGAIAVFYVYFSEWWHKYRHPIMGGLPADSLDNLEEEEEK